MIVESPAIEWVRIVAERLGELRDEVVFLGGATVGLLITDPATTAVRGTKDVDVIVEVVSRGQYALLQERLREKGFAEDTSEDAPVCVESFTLGELVLDAEHLPYLERR